jgi:hypothetical protein
MNQLEKELAIESLQRKLITADTNDSDAHAFLRRLQILTSEKPISIAKQGPTQDTSLDALQAMRNASRHMMEKLLLLLESTETLSLEHEIDEIQLLRCAIKQRDHIIPPRSALRDIKAHNSIPAYLCSPQAFKYNQIEHKVDVVADVGAWLLCKELPFRQCCYYIHKATKSVQTGTPFDFLMKKNRSELTSEQW